MNKCTMLDSGMVKHLFTDARLSELNIDSALGWLVLGKLLKVIYFLSDLSFLLLTVKRNNVHLGRSFWGLLEVTCLEYWNCSANMSFSYQCIPSIRSFPQELLKFGIIFGSRMKAMISLIYMNICTLIFSISWESQSWFTGPWENPLSN
jgi:hypothetical protein